jgi:hypothetical protein
MEYIDTLPLNPEPEAFGMHSNANITSDQNDTYEMFDLLLSLQVWARVPLMLATLRWCNRIMDVSARLTKAAPCEFCFCRLTDP